MNPKEVSLCLISKDPTYPQEVLDSVQGVGFGEILILTSSDSPYRKHELFAKAKYEMVAYQDDDAICPWVNILAFSRPDIINVAMKEGHAMAHQDNRATMGLGWGAVFPKKMLDSLNKYTDIYGEDEVFKRETERIFTYLNYPQNRLVLSIIDLPSAYAEDRLWRQPEHNQFKEIAQQRCAPLVI